MIKNDKQYMVTLGRIKEFGLMLEELEKNSDDSDPIFKKMEIDAIKGQLVKFNIEINEYDLLKKGSLRRIEVKSFSSFYEVLIKARIAKRWSHAELAKKINVKEQQIQRYEGNNYLSASMDRIGEVIAALDLEIPPIKIKVLESKFMLPKGVDRHEMLGRLNIVRTNQTLLPQPQ